MTFSKKLLLAATLAMVFGCKGNSHHDTHDHTVQSESEVSAEKSNENGEIAEIAHPRAKKMAWSAQGDFDCDGKTDSVRLNVVQKTLNIFVKGSISTDTLSLDMDTHDDDGLCGDSAGIDTETLDLSRSDMEEMFDDTLDGYKASSSCLGFYIYDDQCGSFHYYYNHNDKTFNSYRL